MAGFISLHRDIQKHWLYEEERVFSRYEAWLDILMRVNHSEGKITHNGTLEVVLRGSTIWSMGDMEKHWGWSNSKVRAFLLRLKNDGMIEVKSTTKKTYLTVINYDKYQITSNEETPPKHHRNTTETYQKHTNNNELIITNNNLSSSSITPVNEIEAHFLKNRGKGNQVSILDYQEIKNIVDYGIPVDFIKTVLDKSFKEYKPRYPKDEIRSISFCIPRIYSEWNTFLEKQKVGEQRADRNMEEHKGNGKSIRHGRDPTTGRDREESSISRGQWDDTPVPMPQVQG